jgi:hypothetical protein
MTEEITEQDRDHDFFEIVQVVVQVATVTATFDVNLKRPPMDFVQGWDVLTYFFRYVRPDTSRPRFLSIRGQILRVHVLFSVPKCSLTSTGRLRSPNLLPRSAMSDWNMTLGLNSAFLAAGRLAGLNALSHRDAEPNPKPPAKTRFTCDTWCE